MSTPPSHVRSLRDQLSRADCSGRFLWGALASVAIGDLLRGSTLGDCGLSDLSGRSILLAARDQLAAAAALIELDGIAARIVICPPDTPAEQFPSLIETAGVDAIVSDCEPPDCAKGLLQVTCGTVVAPVKSLQLEHRPTEWVLLTSGTSGTPKMILHTLASLMAPIAATQGTRATVV